jgi:DNA-binding MarR family transcriptional regulator
VVHLEDLPWLPLKLVTPAKKAAGVPSTAFPGLSHRTVDFITNQALEGERNNRLFAAACDMVGNDYDYATIRQILTPVALDCDLPAHEIQNTLRSACSQPRDPSRKKQPADVSPTPWLHALAWAESQAWTGRTGQTDRAVFLACIERARVGSYHNGVFRASVREIAELARVNKETASKALKRLQKAKHIRFKGRDTTSRATLWCLDQKPTAGGRKPYTGHPWLINSVRVTRSDASERGALGKTASVVYEVLCAQRQPVMPKVLAGRCRLSRDQVQRALRKLAQYNMVRREPSGWVAVPVDAHWLDKQVAAEAGTQGRGAARKKQHAKERALHAGNELFDMRWRKRRGEAKKPPEHPVNAPPAQPEPEAARFQAFEGVVYCQNCGQGTFVFEEMLLPPVCDFCADNPRWKQNTVWLSEPPSAGESKT